MQHRMTLRLALAAAAVAVCATAAHAADLPLTVAQVEKVTGLKGLSTQPAKYDKASTDFVTPDKRKPVAIKVATASVYEVWKTQGAAEHQAVQGLGDDALSSKKGRYVCFKKGNAGICITGEYLSPGEKPLVSDAQLMELAKVAAGNL